jgi:hypothetical protein
VRLLAAQCVLSLINRLMELDCLAVLNPYFADLVLFLQCQTRDLFPELKVVAAKALETIALLQEFESGMCYFAVALVRILLPLLRHRHAKVRVAGIDAVRACMIVPNRAKRKGSGTEAIVDLVGFKEDNLLNVASFYKPSVSINYLAELTSDATVHVRERLVVMLSSFLVDLEDRYDHQQRLLPYLLDMLTDESPTVSSVALATLVKCGVLYEEQHTDDIIERRQFGIDGDDRCNLDKPLPSPFTEHPRIGIRIYTRGNTKRFIFALVGELTNWQSKTRLKSANLLKMVTVLCEEYLTMEMHRLLPSYIKALQYARDDGDKELEAVLCEVFELAGRYTAPDSYVHYILPRLRGDVEVTQFNMDAASRCCVIDVLKCFVDGSKNSLIPPYLSEIIDVIVDPFVIDPTSNSLHGSALGLLAMVLTKVQGRGLAMTAAHFQSTGRLKNMKDTIHKAFRFIFHSLSNPELNVLGTEALTLLSNLDAEAHALAPGVQGLLLKQLPTLVHSLIDPLLNNEEEDCSAGINEIDGDRGIEIDDIYELDSTETRLLELSLLCPVFALQRDKTAPNELFAQTLTFLVAATSSLVRGTLSSLSSSSSPSLQITSSTASLDEPSVVLKKYADFMLYLLQPYLTSPDSAIESATAKYFANLSDKENILPLELSDVTRSQAELESFFSILIGTFVTPLAWGKDVSLQQKRLNILSSLLEIMMKPDDNEANQRLIAPVLRSLLEGVFRSALSPSTPLEIRLSAAHLFKSVLNIFYDDSVRLVSFVKQDHQQSGGTPHHQTAPEGVRASLRSAMGVIMSTMLDDSNDSIRIIALESLMHVLHFVRPHYDQDVSQSTTTSPHPTPTSALPSFVPAVTSFEGMTDALLLRTINGSPTEEFLGQLDFVLRSLAILNLSKFEELVRSKLPLLVGIHKPPCQASDMFSGLLEHAEMLVQFASLK